MKRLLAVLFICMVALFIAGCVKEAPAEESAQDINTDIESDISDLDTLDKDLDMSEFDNLEQELAELENLDFE